MSLAIGRRLGAYEIVAAIGAGAMGEVYKARDTRLDRFIAIKIVSARDPEADERLRREARAAASLNHPHICTIHEIGEADAGVFIVMEHVEGRRLVDLATEGVPLSTAIGYGCQIADALAHAHDRGIVHRDLKSANVMVTADAQVKVLDFGLARRIDRADDAATEIATTAFGTIAGTLAYMSPEVLRGEAADRRGDIWALGVVLHEMIAGIRPFGGQTTFEISSAILRDAPAALPPHVPESIRAVVTRCLAKDPAERYQYASDVRVALAERLPGGRSRTKTRSAGARIRSLAVLPLDNLSRDPEQEYFADGMTEALITNLAQLQRLRVISRTSVMRFKGTTKQVSEIARELGVDAIVEGSVLRVGDAVRIDAQLIHAASEAHVWAASYEQRLTDVLALQRDIARAIAGEIRVTTGARQKKKSTEPALGVVDAAAYHEYLRGRHHVQRFIEPELRKGIERFQAALDHDPMYGPAYAGLAICHLGLGWLGAVIPHQAFPRAKAAACRALEIDGSILEAHLALGYVATFYDWDWSTAERELQTALSLQPSAADAHLYYAWYLNARSRHDEADSAVRRAFELDPLSALVAGNVAYLAIFARRFGIAEDYARQALDLDPTNVMARWTLGIAIECLGRHDDAIEEFDVCLRVWPGGPILGWLGYACARAGQADRARELLGALQRIEPTRAARSVEVARVHVALGEADHALTALLAACDAREGSLGYIKSDPCWDPIADHQTFAAIVHRLGLA